MSRWLPQFSHKRAESGTSRASDARGSSAGIPSNVRQAEAVDTIYQSTLRQINDLSTLCNSFLEAQGVLPTATVEKLKEEFANLHVSLSQTREAGREARIFRKHSFGHRTSVGKPSILCEQIGPVCFKLQ